MKQIKFDKEAREKLEAGVKKLNDAVSSTLGAKGRNVIFQHGKNYLVTKDGVTVASQVELEDSIENAGAQIVKDAANRTARDAGDGTTTATVIACAIIEQALYHVGAKANPMDLKRGIDMAVEDVINYIDKLKHEIKGQADIYNIARISGNNDPEIGKMISDIFKRVGKNGAIRLEETQANDTTVDVIEGCQFNSGYLSPVFITNQTKRTADYKDAVVLITDKIFQESFDDLIPALDIVIAKSEEIQKPIPILIICGGMEGETLGTLGINRAKKNFPVVAVNAPDFGTERLESLEDIAIITGGTVISEEKGIKITDIQPEHFGHADRIIVEQFGTTIIGRHGEAPAIQERVKTIEAQIEEDKNHTQKWRLNKRIAMMTGGVGVIYVGGNSETEMKDSYFRIEDALAATKAALDDGYVAGGGVAYLRAALASESELISDERSDITLGYLTLLNALKTPLETIADNAGKKGIIVANDVANNKSANYGYDALEDNYGNMIKKGIIDPAKVVKTAIKNAASVAGMLITTNCVINDIPKK
jgi:chaperonin GroEL